MTDAPTSPAVIPAEAGTPCPADAADWARAYGMRQLEMLGELAEIGLDVARAVERQASGRYEPPVAEGLNHDGPVLQGPVFPARVFQGDLALAYFRVSRAVRLTLMLQAKLIEDLKASDAGGATARSAAEAEAAPAYRMKVRVENIVGRLAEARHPRDEAAVDRVMREAAERLDDEDLYGDLLERPVSELVARLCKDLGLDPDWAELAEELWAVREVQSGEVGWPLAERVLPCERQRTGEVAQRAGGGELCDGQRFGRHANARQGRAGPQPQTSNSALFTSSA